MQLDLPHHKKVWKRLKLILLNEQGQLSIFIALIFQVLFVFFAMVINVGLLVHDKINLQNAADLAAYYGAERQGEVLNEIAHMNYQLRQDYKLLAWRYRVLGTLGRQGTTAPTETTFPPARKSSPSALSEKEWVNSAYGVEPPSVCVANDSWSDMVANSTQAENYCFSIYGDPKPKIPDLPIIADFVPGLLASAEFTKEAQKQQQLSCENAGPLNWAFTMQMIYAYKLAIAARKEAIWTLRANLVSDSFIDHNAESVKDGVKKTLIKNLTEANKNGQPNIEMINGLADKSCNRDDNGEFVMPEIKTVPTLLFSNIHCGPNEDGSVYMVAHQDFSNLDQTAMQRWDPQGLMQMLAKSEPEQTNPLHSTLGFEKNPWCMAYVGVKVTTSTKKPFSPFGGAIPLEAHAFAQPFGGRVGPWYRERWTKGAPTSAEGNRVDPLTSPRLLTSGALDDATPIVRLPNYSRFPGDQLGLKSELALGAENAEIRALANNPDKTHRLQLKYYAGFDSIPTSGDVLTSNGSANFPLRQAEIAAITPDLFDAVYYSIDPNYYQAYMSFGSARFQGLNPILGHQVNQLPDAGGALGGNGQPGFNVSNQISTAVGGGLDPNVLPKLFYVLRDWTKLLTGWVAASVSDYTTFPTQRFGQCAADSSPQIPIPGRCAQGGRVGYSIRLISRSALKFQQWQIGGDGEQPGPILNPPSDDF